MKPIKCVLFDLDGTLLPMDQTRFIKQYFAALIRFLAPHGYRAEALTDAMWQGIEAMLKNSGSESNEKKFWKVMQNVLGSEVKNDLPVFEAFYQTEFPKLSALCGHDPSAAETVKALKAEGYTVALATQPVYPRVATEHRVQWTGLSCSDFAHVTTYENSHSCKPSEHYFRSLAALLGFAPEECLMVGNDTTDDMLAEAVGMRVFLLTPCLINPSEESIDRYPHGDFSDLMAYIRSERENA